MIPEGMARCWEGSWGALQQDERVVRCWEGSARL